MELIILKDRSEYEIWSLFILGKVVAYINIWALGNNDCIYQFQKWENKLAIPYYFIYQPTCSEVFKKS